MTEKKGLKFKKFNNAVTEKDAMGIIERTLDKQKSKPEVNVGALTTDLNSTANSYFMRAGRDLSGTSRQHEKALREADTALKKVMVKLGISVDFDNNEEAQKAINYSAVFQRLETAMINMDARDDINPSINITLSSYKIIAVLKRACTVAVAEKEKTTKTGNKHSAEAWLIGNALPAIYQSHFKKDYGTATQKDGAKGGPAIRFIQSVYRALFNRDITADAIDKAHKRYQ